MLDQWNEWVIVDYRQVSFFLFFFLAISWWEKVIFRSDDDDMRFVLDQYA